ncbi:hypothetical protein VL20_11 [Microcystis panniformis FACHB-1757]|uniref:Uncharacterized protein n=1 Tax=Microcystis panniformis FACHB-1757 TaxID=1638788 RepID=A0A0K1RU81_9CHRO|nr:hypothetical protein VL20_11 [Microcystis panniformis FACHB-1757]
MNFCLEESCVSFLNWRAVKMPLSLKPDARPPTPCPHEKLFAATPN